MWTLDGPWWKPLKGKKNSSTHRPILRVQQTNMTIGRNIDVKTAIIQRSDETFTSISHIIEIFTLTVISNKDESVPTKYAFSW